jgi:hypothetical protein
MVPGWLFQAVRGVLEPMLDGFCESYVVKSSMIIPVLADPSVLPVRWTMAVLLFAARAVDMEIPYNVTPGNVHVLSSCPVGATTWTLEF